MQNNISASIIQIVRTFEDEEIMDMEEQQHLKETFQGISEQLAEIPPPLSFSASVIFVHWVV